MNTALAASSALACAEAERILNQALQYNPESTAILSKHEGKSVRITSTLPDADILIGLRESSLYLLPVYRDDVNKPSARADARLTGHAIALLLFLVRSDNSTAATRGHDQGSVTLAGDRELVVELARLFAALHIDREAWLAAFIGDLPAHLIGQSLRQFHERAHHANRHGREAMENFLRDEWRANPIVLGARAVGDSLTADTDGEPLKQHRTRISDSLGSRLARIFA